MVRILVLIEDYKDQIQLRALLKKVGCEVELTSNELGVKEKVLTFKPDILLVSGVGKKISPASVSKKMKEVVGVNPKMIVILAPGVRISLNDLSENKFDGFIESPIDPMRLMVLISKLTSGKADDLEIKFQRMISDGTLGSSLDGVGDKKIIKGNFGSPASANFSPPSLKDLQDKMLKYSQMAEGITVSEVSTISKISTRAIVKELQKSWDRKMLDDIDEEKRKVARLLFKK